MGQLAAQDAKRHRFPIISAHRYPTCRNQQTNIHMVLYSLWLCKLRASSPFSLGKDFPFLCVKTEDRRRLKMGKKGYLAMRTDTDTTDLISSDLRDLGNAAKKLATHAIKLGGLGFGTTFLEWLASFAAMYVLFLSFDVYIYCVDLGGFWIFLCLWLKSSVGFFLFHCYLHHCDEPIFCCDCMSFVLVLFCLELLWGLVLVIDS